MRRIHAALRGFSFSNSFFKEGRRSVTEEMIPVTVIVESTVRTDGEMPETVRSASPGCLRKRRDSLILTYTEGEAEGAKIFNRLLCDADSVTVERRGAVISRLTYRAGLTDRTLYKLAMLEGELEVKTKNVTVKESDGCLTVSLDFSTLFCGIPGETRLSLTAVARKEGQGAAI
jgi:uncharacterized beta-barrel protein YwiB (DUF1934 family)